MNKYLLLSFLPFCFLACTNSEGLSSEYEGVKVNFSTRGIVAQVASTRADASSLAEGATIRVQVYKHTGTATDLTATNYVGDNTYVVGTDGSLSTCVVDAMGTVTSTTGSDLYLRSGDYDFYAVTPALTLSTSGETTAVPQGMDYATSLTQGVSVSSTLSTQSVALTTLERKCAQLVFKIDRAITTITSVAIDELILTGLAVGPLTGTMNNALSTAASNTGSVTLANSNFTYDATDQYKASASTIVLPKTDGTMQLSMTVYFNGHTTARTISSVTVPSIAFEAGTQYIFTLKLYGDQVVLSLTSSSSASWETATTWNSTIGGGAVTVGSASNCYIVAPGAGVSIPVSRANESTIAIDGATLTSGTYYQILSTTDWSASLLWETTPGLIGMIGKTGTGSSGRFTVFANSPVGDNGGNAVVVVKNSSGTILWSWHIWVTSYNPNTGTTNTLNNGYRDYVFMDRNLGATRADYNTTDAGARGLYYQWGRKDPFPGSNEWTATEPTLYGSQTAVKTISTIGFTTSVCNPGTFICTSSSPYDWYGSTQNNYLWNNSSGEKTVYDPCPVGWRVPVWSTSSPWRYLVESNGIFTYSGSGYSGTFSNGYSFMKSSSNIGYYPASGVRGTGSGTVASVGSFGYYWSASTSTVNTIYGYGFHFYTNYVFDAYSDNRGSAFGIRCVKE